MPRFKEKADRVKKVLAQNTSYSLCYALCCILLAFFIIALLVIPFASLSSEADAKADRGEEENIEDTAKQVDASVNANGAEDESETLSPQTVFPLDGRITSEYGWRESPVSTSAGYTFHYGIDISASESDAILAYKSGTVKETGYSASYGYYILISHNDHDSFYAHCDEVYASAGDTVECGEIIARAGQTGRATGKHLHFEIRVNGTAVDPLSHISPYEN